MVVQHTRSAFVLVASDFHEIRPFFDGKTGPYFSQSLGQERVNACCAGSSAAGPENW